MKVLVCCLFVIANISDNGKASLESFTPASSNFLLEDTTKNSDKSCYRPCKFNVKPKRCLYKFKIELNISNEGTASLTINGKTPGPPIQACINDVIVVEVENKIPNQDISIHWHGLEQKGTPYMDGTPMVSQCPISYGSMYRYAFIASSPGTFFYHADSVSHQSDGVYGSLVINQPQPLEPHSSLYDYDRSDENTLLIAAKFPVMMTGNLEDMSRVAPKALLINGDEENTKLFVMQGFAYRLRLINAIGVECLVFVHIDRHEMVAIATDGRPVKPVQARSVQLYPVIRHGSFLKIMETEGLVGQIDEQGRDSKDYIEVSGERMDVVVRATQESGGYWVRVQGSGLCANVSANAMLLYSGFNYTSMLQVNKNEIRDDTSLDSIGLNGQMMESLQDASFTSKPKTVYLGIDRNIVKYKDSELDYRYISDAIPKKPHFPAALAVQEKGVVQINGKSFLYPNTPILLRPNDVVASKICHVGAEYKQEDSQCVQILEAVEGETLEIALVNEGVGSNDSYTFHMHGPGVHVIGTGQNFDGTPLSKNQFLRMDREKKIFRNLQNPPIKDTITVPNKGYVIIRTRPEKGSWLLECRSCALSSLPAAVIIQTPHILPKAVLDALPKCGNYRPPDVLLN